jgi:hypothetical protein
MSCYAADRWGMRHFHQGKPFGEPSSKDDFALAFPHPRGPIMHGAW